MSNRGVKRSPQRREMLQRGREETRGTGARKKGQYLTEGIRHVQKMGGKWVGEGPSGNREGTNMGRKADHKGRTTAASMGICLNDNTRSFLPN